MMVTCQLESGMGSSSCFTVGLIKAINALNEKKFSKIELYKKAIYFEQKLREKLSAPKIKFPASIEI